MIFLQSMQCHTATGIGVLLDSSARPSPFTASDLVQLLSKRLSQAVCQCLCHDVAEIIVHLCADGGEGDEV